MLAWFFAGFWHALVGLILLVVVFGGGIIVLARTISKGVEHDRARCQCAECQRIRRQAYAKRKDKLDYWEERERRMQNAGWVSTYSLVPGNIVESKNRGLYRVTAKVDEGDGIKVHLIEELKDTISFRKVPYDDCDRLMWKRVY